MKRINVTSSSIKSVGYDIYKRLLEIEFTRGAIYQYKCVDYVDVLNLLFSASVSAGKYFDIHIKNGYEYEKIN